MFPIVGERYKCNDCEEAIGFDLCGECYNTSSKLPGRFNQQHTLEHKFELVNYDLIRNIMRRLVSEHFEDSSAPVLSDDASEDLEDGLLLMHPLMILQRIKKEILIPPHKVWLCRTTSPLQVSVPLLNTIRDMVVHGAPAIAIFAALSLAVEVFNMEPFVGTSENTTSFLFNKLDYLVSSRPTTVNLSNAAVKLKDVITKSVASSGDSKYVFQAYIEFAETMLEDDVASNKAIGSYGASFIKNTLKDSKNISILTHCNTGSLATAGYGTTLGVIRALHTDGVLEKAFCTKTQPFNQASTPTLPCIFVL
ncbi:hypothetical protein IFM89_006243 [Coptis chinensis]|uniref:ZZ-type domain-containing protein n=1 Tax=Coptis chinensis TaxID=261450 RepID=A0A835IX81_9MAGN|nr:hypothetical protein IFM89_006243 [Coptis chinensis]